MSEIIKYCEEQEPLIWGNPTFDAVEKRPWLDIELPVIAW